MKRAWLAVALAIFHLPSSIRAGGPATYYTVTAYCPCVKCCGPWAGGKTASGQRPRPGLTVAGPRAVPFGTRIQIAGVGERVVQDRLARAYDHRFDIYFSNHQTARRFGTRRLAIRFLP